MPDSGTQNLLNRVDQGGSIKLSDFSLQMATIMIQTAMAPTLGGMQWHAGR